MSKRHFVCTDAKNNNNKYWNVEWDETTGNTTVTYGRVGTLGVSENYNWTRSQYESKIKSKLKKRSDGTFYTEVDIISESSITPTTASKEMVKKSAMDELAGNCPILKTLVKRLIEENKHELYQSTGGKIQVNIDTGAVTTELGVVSKSMIDTARNHLQLMSPFVLKGDLDNDRYLENLNQYLRFIPQDVGRTRGWHTRFLTDQNSLVKQNDLLDQLEASVDLAESSINSQLTADQPKNLFNTSIKLVEDADTIKMVEKMFFSTLNSQHVSSKLKPVRVYEVTLNNMKEAYEKDGAKMNDQRMLWHGTRAFNILSIFKNGLMIPKSGGSINITGRMFGDGIYTSDQSSKALNYSYGYWDGGTKDSNCFMFLCDVAMGNYHVPTSPSASLHRYGYDSVWAKPGKSGIMNNEMIVYRTSQCNIRYLVEFSK